MKENNKDNNKENNKLKTLITTLQKDFGKEFINVSSDYRGLNCGTISSGSFLLDKILGGGYPQGRIVEIFGPESSGKSTLALHAVASLQENGGQAAFIDVENAFDLEFSKNIGVDVDNLIMSQPDSGEQVFAICEALIKSKAVSLIVVDSVAALIPEVELNGDIYNNTIALQARLMSKGLRRINSIVNKNNVTLIFINQLREKVGVVFGNPEITPGGRSLKFYASQRIEVRRSQNIMRKEEIVGVMAKVKVVKNKISAPFKKTVLEIFFKGGVSKNREYIRLALSDKIIKQNGTWYQYGDVKIGPGKEKLVLWFEEHPKKLQEIILKLKK